MIKHQQAITPAKYINALKTIAFDWILVAQEILGRKKVNH